MIANLKKLIAKQLNDYDDSPSGVDQGTYFRWKEHHIEDALLLGASYLANLLPSYFARVKEFTVKCDGCTVEIPKTCETIVSIVGVNGDCANAVETRGNTYSLMPLLGTECLADSGTMQYEYELLASHTIQFSTPVSKGDIITVMCSKAPKSLDELGSLANKHSALLVNFALWFLFLSDSESISNLERSDKHYVLIKDYVTQVLLLEFSLREDDYKFGRRKVDDNN